MKAIIAASWMCALAPLMLGQQPPSPPEAPAQQQQNPAATTAPPEISPDDPDSGEPEGAFYWFTRGSSKIRPGPAPIVCGYYCAPSPIPPGADQTLGLPSVRPRTPGAFVSIPGGKFNHIEISYFQADGSGTGYAAAPLNLFGGNIPQGYLISTTYRVRNAQLTWNYLTWPAPPEDSKWRFRTLWSFNYTSVSPTIDAPFDPDPNFTPPHGTKNIYYPAFGIATEYVPNKHFFFEARAWGFGIPHHADIGDAELNVVARFKALEVFGGYKLFHYKTSQNADIYAAGTIKGPLAGVRWVFR